MRVSVSKSSGLLGNGARLVAIVLKPESDARKRSQNTAVVVVASWSKSRMSIEDLSSPCSRALGRTDWKLRLEGYKIRSVLKTTYMYFTFTPDRPARKHFTSHCTAIVLLNL
jgi:hypothetical protein